ncbi:MAG: bifunctional phosphoglucose/phosphomannose isomerase [Lewinellaceae bacterium]|nr:bifunctional phosphoglucose/phosphomannose isomerase [Lewinellaceae bacterium]
MQTLIEKFPFQLRDAVEAVAQIHILPHDFEIRNICIFGMGGSGIGGKFVKDMLCSTSKLPIEVYNGYEIPKFIDKHTLVIASSYSGNTEETVSNVQALLSSQAKIVCITSGGALLDIAKHNSLEFVQLPSGSRSPRAFLGYSIVCQLGVLKELKLIDSSVLEQVKVAIDLLIFEQEDIKVKSHQIAQSMAHKLPLMYTSERMESVSIRWRQQINENAKMLCHQLVFPEMNHNEIEGWNSAQDKTLVVLLRNKDDHKRNQLRFEIVKDQLKHKTSSIIEIYSKGQSLVEKMMYLTHFGDWVSYYLAVVQHIDPISIGMIDHLKNELSKNENL